MLPGALFSTYKQYKDDTQKIIKWLAEAATRCGYDPNAEDDGAKKQKLKGRARKLARDAAQAATKSNTSANQTYTVKVREIVPMARSIVESKDNKVIIPLNILKTFKRCIQARDTTNKWYERQESTVSEKQDNLSHEFFVENLKQSLQILIPVAKLRELDENRFALPTPTVEIQADAKLDSNRFAHLEIQDVDEQEYERMADAPAASMTSATDAPPVPKKKKYVPEELDDFSEFHFALVCLMEDVETLQGQIKEFWTEYAEGDIDLTTAAVTTNTAIEMVKKTEEEFAKLKRPSAYHGMYKGSIPDMWFTECCIRDGISPAEFVDNDDVKYFVPMVAWEQAKESYLLLFRLAIIYSKGVIPDKTGDQRVFAMTRPAYLGTYNPELEFDDLSPEKQYEQVSALLNDMFATLGGYCVFGNETPNDDMLLEGLYHFQRHQIEPPLWLLFACQAFLDIHFILKTRSERPWEELRDFAISSRKTIKAHQKFLQAHPLPHMRPIDGEDEIAVDEILQEMEEWIFKDKIKQILTSVPGQGKSKKKRIWQDFEILRISPLLCGMWKYCFHIQLQWKGITLVNDTGIVTVAHLYNALQQNDFLGTGDDALVWEDMEYLLDLHRAEDTFMGKERPVSIEDCTKRLALVQGVAPQTFARRRRGNNHRVMRSRAGSKFLVPSTPVAKVFGQKYLTRTEGEWHLEQLDAIVGRKFESDKKEYQAINKKRNALVNSLELKTEEGRRELLLSFVPPGLREENKERPYENDVAVAVFFAELAIRAAAFDCNWVKPLREVVTEERLKYPDAFKEEARADMFANMSRDDEIDESIAKTTSEVGQAPQPAEIDIQAIKTTGSSSDTKAKHNIDTIDSTSNDSDSDSDSDEDEDEDEEYEQHSQRTRPGSELLREIMERWEQTKTLPLEVFIDIVCDSLQDEYLDIQFDYFAFFRSVFSLMLQVHEALVPLLEPRLIDVEGGPQFRPLIFQNEGAVCIIPQISLLVACDPLEAPNLLVMKPWLSVDMRPLRMIAEIMKPWIEAHGDEYCLNEEEREERRREEVTREAPPLMYIDDDDSSEDEMEARVKKDEDRKIGWSSSVGIMEGLNAKQMRKVFDDQRVGGAMGLTVAQTMAKLHGFELDDEDRELIAINEEINKGAEDARVAREKTKERMRKKAKRKNQRSVLDSAGMGNSEIADVVNNIFAGLRNGNGNGSEATNTEVKVKDADDVADSKVDSLDELD